MPIEKLKPPPVPPKLVTLKGNNPKNEELLTVHSKNHPSEVKPQFKRTKSVSFSEQLAIINHEEPCYIQVEVNDETAMDFEEVSPQITTGAQKPLLNNTNLAPELQTSLESGNDLDPISPSLENSDSENTSKVEVPKRNKLETTATLNVEIPNSPPKLPPRGIHKTFSGGYTSLDILPPPIPPKPQKLNRTSNLNTLKIEADPNDSPATSSVVHREKKKKAIPRPTTQPPPPPPPAVQRQLSLQSVNSHVQDANSRLVVITRDVMRREQKFLDHIQEGIEIARKFKAENIPEPTINKFFGFLEEIHLLHYQFLVELQTHLDISKYFVPCFLKHVLKLDVYIDRQWLVPTESTLEHFEKFLIESQNLKPFLTLTREKIEEYLKDLQYFSSSCYRENSNVVRGAIMAVGDLYYQLEMVEQFKKIDDIENKVKNSGKVYLNHTFKVSVDGNKRKPYVIYFCEKKIIFTTQNKNTGIYQYFDDILTSACYCSQRVHQPLIFEIGLIDRKRFTIKAESQYIKERWCVKMKKILRDDQFQN